MYNPALIENEEVRYSEKGFLIVMNNMKFVYTLNPENSKVKVELPTSFNLEKMLEIVNSLINSKLYIEIDTNSKFEIECIYNPPVNTLKPIKIIVPNNPISEAEDLFKRQKNELAHKICAYAVDKLNIAEAYENRYGKPELTYDKTLEMMNIFLSQRK
ncbi:MAG: hypothetical protein KC550_01470 [Nanoarchaeota archaeon]|nr:hypothetical protein [Nanoarchaeota archaeon]